MESKQTILGSHCLRKPFCSVTCFGSSSNFQDINSTHRFSTKLVCSNSFAIHCFSIPLSLWSCNNSLVNSCTGLNWNCWHNSYTAPNWDCRHYIYNGPVCCNTPALSPRDARLRFSKSGIAFSSNASAANRLASKSILILNRS